MNPHSGPVTPLRPTAPRKRIIAMKSGLQNGRTATGITMQQMLKQNSFVLQRLMSFMCICKCNLGNLCTFFVHKIKMTYPESKTKNKKTRVSVYLTDRLPTYPVIIVTNGLTKFMRRDVTSKLCMIRMV